MKTERFFPSFNRKLSALGATIAVVLLLVCSAGAETWIGTWATASSIVANSKSDYARDTTLRQIVHVSIGGPRIRVTLSNELGTEELKVGGASVALSDGHGGLKGEPHPLTFGGRAEITIPPGVAFVSDPLTFALPDLADLAITLYVPGQTISTLTQHVHSSQASYSAEGNHMTDADLSSSATSYSWTFLKSVDVSASEKDGGAIVCLGDSITDGVRSTNDKNARWPDVLARRLHANKGTQHLGVLNVGISGNRLLHDLTGPSALSRFDRDVLAQSGVRFLIVLEGINDVSHTTHPTRPNDGTEKPMLAFALDQIIERAHAHGIKVLGATLTPFGGSKTEDAQGETMRAAENEFIRSSGHFDGVIDFDKATRDPADPLKFAAAADGGDHLHPGDTGYEIMGNAIDLKLFTK